MDSNLIDPSEVVYVKKEDNLNEYSFNDCDVKEEVASIYDDEQGYLLTTSFEKKEIGQESDVLPLCTSASEHFKGNNQFVLGLVNDEGKQDESYILTKNIRRKTRRERKSINNKDVKFSLKTKGCLGRISRGTLFADKEYFCDTCQKHYQGRRHFVQHINIHYTSSQNKYVCLICSLMYGTVSHMNRHILEKHFLKDFEVEKLFTCFHCKKRFNQKKDLERHMFVHTGEGAWKCDKCDYSSVTKYRLNIHMGSAHSFTEKTDIPEFICDHCNYITSEKSALRTHIKRHMGNKSVKCPECRYVCTTNGDLKKHSATHSNDRPFGCDRCNKTFKRRSHLLMHFNLKYVCGSTSGRKLSRV